MIQRRGASRHQHAETERVPATVLFTDIVGELGGIAVHVASRAAAGPGED